MKLVIQRVSRAEVRVGGNVVGRIEKGLVALVGAERGDDGAVAEETARKLAGLRIFEDTAGKMKHALEFLGVPVATGVFGEKMEVELVNDGPATFILEVNSRQSTGNR